MSFMADKEREIVQAMKSFATRKPKTAFEDRRQGELS